MDGESSLIGTSSSGNDFFPEPIDSMSNDVPGYHNEEPPLMEPNSAEAPEAYNTTGKDASDFYMNCMQNRNQLPAGLISQQESVAKQCLLW